MCNPWSTMLMRWRHCWRGFLINLSLFFIHTKNFLFRWNKASLQFCLLTSESLNTTFSIEVKTVLTHDKYWRTDKTGAQRLIVSDSHHLYPPSQQFHLHWRVIAKCLKSMLATYTVRGIWKNDTYPQFHFTSFSRWYRNSWDEYWEMWQYVRLNPPAFYSNVVSASIAGFCASSKMLFVKTFSSLAAEIEDKMSLLIELRLIRAHETARFKPFDQ